MATNPINLIPAPVGVGKSITIPVVAATVVSPGTPVTEKNAKNFKPQPTRQERDMKREKRTEQLEQENARLKKELEGFRKQEQEKKADRRQANLPPNQMLAELTYLKQRIKALEADKTNLQKQVKNQSTPTYTSSCTDSFGGIG